MKIVVDVGTEIPEEERLILEEMNPGLSWILQRKDTSVTINYTLDMLEMETTARRVSALRSLATQGGTTVEDVGIQDAFYHLDCMREDLKAILEMAKDD